MILPDTSSAMVFDAPGEPLRCERLPLRPPAAAEVLVRVTCCTICGSDLHSYTGRRPAPTPMILGHEIVGIIEALGPIAPTIDLRCQPLRVGDRITWTLAASCGTCATCMRGLPQKCEHLLKYGHERITEAMPLSGGLAEFCMLAAGTSIIRLPDTLPDAAACPANCATATVAAALRVAGPCADQAVLIFGAGMLGLTACAMTRDAGASTVICCDVNDQRLREAARFGATHVFRPDLPGFEDDVRKLTAGQGVDLVLEISGSAQAAEMGLKLLRLAGRAIWVGTVSPGPPVAVDPEMIVRRLLSIHGVHNYIPADLLTAIDFLSATRYPFADLVQAEYSLEEADAALNFSRTGAAVRVAVLPGRTK